MLCSELIASVSEMSQRAVNCDLTYVVRLSINSMLKALVYGHTKAQSLILCSPNSNSNPNPKQYLGFGHKVLVFCRNIG